MLQFADSRQQTLFTSPYQPPPQKASPSTAPPEHAEIKGLNGYYAQSSHQNIFPSSETLFPSSRTTVAGDKHYFSTAIDTKGKQISAEIDGIKGYSTELLNQHAYVYPLTSSGNALMLYQQQQKSQSRGNLMANSASTVGIQAQQEMFHHFLEEHPTPTKTGGKRPLTEISSNDRQIAEIEGLKRLKIEAEAEVGCK